MVLTSLLSQLLYHYRIFHVLIVHYLSCIQYYPLRMVQIQRDMVACQNLYRNQIQVPYRLDN